jgi:hypothetical protein
VTQLAALLTALLGFVKTLLGIARERKIEQGGIARQEAAQKDQVIEIVQEVRDAKNAAELEYVRDPERVLANDDGFRRD